MTHSSHSPRLPSSIDPAWRVGIVHSTYYKEENESLAQAARETLLAAGLADENITLHPVLGSFEVPLVGAALAAADAVDALIGFGIVVQGETPHAEHIVREVARGIMDVQVQYQVPFAFEVLHVHSLEQARARAVGEGNKGVEAASAVLHSLAELQRLQS